MAKVKKQLFGFFRGHTQTKEGHGEIHLDLGDDGGAIITLEDNKLAWGLYSEYVKVTIETVPSKTVVKYFKNKKRK